MAVPSDHDIILALGEDLPVGIWIARVPGGEQVYVNRTFTQIMGTDARGEAQAGHYAEPYGIYTRDGTVYPEARLPFVRAIEERQVVVVDDLTIRRPDGTSVDVRAFARPVFDAADTITHVVIAFFDITREVAAERARAESDQRLQAAQRLESVGTLAGGIAHDFNNLMFGIKLIVAELATSARQVDLAESLALIDDITDRSATLTRSLLGFARRGKHRAQPVALNDVVASIAELLRRTATGADIEFEFGAREFGVVLGDPSQLEQVVMNLVANARDALQGTGRIVIRTRDAELLTPPDAAIGARLQGRYAVLEVADDGPGIPVDLRHRVFEPYFTTKNLGPDRGTGLGLATVYGIVEAHGGAIEIAHGHDGRGTTVRVYLPASERPAARQQPATPTAIATGVGLVMIVDDDDVVRNVLARLLGSIGYEVVTAAGGAEAVEHQRTRGPELRGVLLDLVMPGMNGRATYLALREHTPGVRVVLMSGHALNEEVQELLDLGARAYLPKPHTLAELAATLARALSDGA